MAFFILRLEMIHDGLTKVTHGSTRMLDRPDYLKTGYRLTIMWKQNNATFQILPSHSESQYKQLPTALRCLMRLTLAGRDLRLIMDQGCRLVCFDFWYITRYSIDCHFWIEDCNVVGAQLI